MRKFDLVVVGAGIGGGALVYNLLKQGFTGSMLIVDKGESVATGATAYSAGGFRNLWTTPINQQLCTKSIDILSKFRDDMDIAIGFNQNGYLFTYYEKTWNNIPKAAEIWKSNNVNFELLTPNQIESKIPGLHHDIAHMDAEVRSFLELERIVGGVFGHDCGSFDPSQAAVGYFERSATDFSVKPVLQLNTEAETVTFDSKGCVTGITLIQNGNREVISTGMVALCTGPWTNELLERSGCPAEDHMPIASQKRMLFITDFPDQNPIWQNIPLTIIDKGIYFKAESGNLMIGKAKPDAPHSLDITFEPDYYVNDVNLIMQERMPSTATCKLKQGWAHLYDTTMVDHNAILGWHENHPGMLLQVGYSGHGAMEAPAVGVCLAELIMNNKYQTIDCSPLRWSRFRENDLVKETIVI